MTEEWNISHMPNWDRYFRKFDSEIQLQILKKISQLMITSNLAVFIFSNIFFIPL